MLVAAPTRTCGSTLKCHLMLGPLPEAPLRCQRPSSTSITALWLMAPAHSSQRTGGSTSRQQQKSMETTTKSGRKRGEGKRKNPASLYCTRRASFSSLFQDITDMQAQPNRYISKNFSCTAAILGKMMYRNILNSKSLWHSILLFCLELRRRYMYTYYDSSRQVAAKVFVGASRLSTSELEEEKGEGNRKEQVSKLLTGGRNNLLVQIKQGACYE